MDEPETPQDVLEGVLPQGQVHLWSGAPGSGKTALAAWMLAQLERGEPSIFGFQAHRPPYIGVIAVDHPWVSHQFWFDRAGFEDVPHYSLVDDALFATSRLKRKAERMQVFEHCLAQLQAPPRGALIFVDPLALFLGGQLNDYDTCAIAMIELSRICIARNMTIIGLLHAGKQIGDPRQRYARPQDRVAGSTAQTGYAGTSFHLSPPTESGEDWHELTIAPRARAAVVLRLRQRPQDGLFEPVAPSDPTTREKTRYRRKFDVLELLPPDCSPIHILVLVERANMGLGIKRATVYRYVAQLAAEGLIEQVPDQNGYWRRTAAPIVAS